MLLVLRNLNHSQRVDIPSIGTRAVAAVLVLFPSGGASEATDSEPAVSVERRGLAFKGQMPAQAVNQIHPALP
ncbi:hypothetical protein TgHK011_001729 [Trichoderma gracile]|nr:hypothetical protein TgHK011_001729 [Trichoderma gracile]